MATTFGRVARIPRLLICVLAFFGASAALLAHTVPVEQVVAIDARIDAGSLVVRLHIPLDALSGSGLPRSTDGTLSPDVTTAQLDTVAADAVRNLDLRAEQALRPLLLTASAAADRTALDVNAAFASATLEGIDARVNAFQGDTLKPVVTMLQVHRVDGQTLQMRIDGPATRVTLDPGSDDVVSRFAALSAHVVIGWGDQVLILLCLLATPLSVPHAGRRIGSLLAAQLAGMLLLRTAGIGGGWLPGAAVIAASTVVLAGVQAALRVRASYITAIAIGFGVLNGAGLAASLVEELAFAGTHRLLAVGVFTLFTVVAEAWMAAIAFAVRRWLADRGVQEVLVRYGVAGFVVHAGLHRFADTGAVVASSGSFIATHAVMLVTVGWVAVILATAAAEALRKTPRTDLTVMNAGS